MTLFIILFIFNIVSIPNTSTVNKIENHCSSLKHRAQIKQKRLIYIISAVLANAILRNKKSIIWSHQRWTLIYPFLTGMHRIISTTISFYWHLYCILSQTHTHTWTLCNYGLMCLSRDSVKKIKEVNIMSCPWSHFPSVGALSAHRPLDLRLLSAHPLGNLKKIVCCGLCLAYHWSVLLRATTASTRKRKWLQNMWRSNNLTHLSPF